MQSPDALILAGGLGTRLRGVVSDRPKVLAEVHGRPFLTFLLDILLRAGIRRVVLCTGYMAASVAQTLGSSYRGITLKYSQEPEPYGTGGALRLGLPFATSDPVLVMNGDSYCDADLSLFFSQHAAAASKASLLLTMVEDTSRYGTVEIDETNAVTRFTEKGKERGAGMINAGIYLLSRRVIESMAGSGSISLERELFPSLIGKGLHAFCHSSNFIDIGIPTDYMAASSLLKGDVVENKHDHK